MGQRVGGAARWLPKTTTAGSTPEAFKRTMLAAKSIAYSRTGASGIIAAKLMERLGIAETEGQDQARGRHSGGRDRGKGGSRDSYPLPAPTTSVRCLRS